MNEEVPNEKKPLVLICPKCGKKVIHKGVKMTLQVECLPEWGSKPADFVLGVKAFNAVIICAADKCIMVEDNPATKLAIPDKKIVIAR